MLRDPNGIAMPTLDSFNVEKSVPTAFAGGTTNARGDNDGTSDPLTLFEVTGDVLVRLYGVCTVNLAGATATVEVGLTGNTALLLPQSTATDFVAGDVWVDASPAEVRGVLLATVPATTLITNGSDIIETVGTADITAGNIYYVCLWRPVLPGSTVVASHSPTSLP